MKFSRAICLASLASVLALSLAGCRATMRDPLLTGEGVPPNCGPMARPCPPLIPEFEAPPFDRYGGVNTTVQTERRVEERSRVKGYQRAELPEEVSDK